VLRNLIAAMVSLSLVSTAVAQDWAIKMFNTTSHDFGQVPRGSKTFYKFQVKNLYEEDAHIAGVRSSCGCTTPVIVKPDLKTFETGEIVAEFNTINFSGDKEATITVVFDKPFGAEVQLQVKGFIRSDVVLQPGAVDFGTVDVGTVAEKKLAIRYAGRANWSVLQVKNPPGLETTIAQTSRGRGEVSYELAVRLKKDTAVGYLQDQITLVTNDPRNPEIQVDVEGRIVSEISVAPASLFLGAVQTGQKVTKPLIVRGKRPFKILSVVCDDASFDVTTDSQAKTVHQMTVVFTAGDKLGKIAQQIGVETDQGAMPTFTAYAHVVSSSQPVVATANHGPPRDPDDESE
jgi:hypothetical protein